MEGFGGDAAAFNASSCFLASSANFLAVLASACAFASASRGFPRASPPPIRPNPPPLPVSPASAPPCHRRGGRCAGPQLRDLLLGLCDIRFGCGLSRIRSGELRGGLSDLHATRCQIGFGLGFVRNGNSEHLL